MMGACLHRINKVKCLKRSGLGIGHSDSLEPQNYKPRARLTVQSSTDAWGAPTARERKCLKLRPREPAPNSHRTTQVDGKAVISLAVRYPAIPRGHWRQ